ncbi:MAG: hypothetical protein H0X30_25615 [Anaerolineae bacterium]|nr:hypothetical protein [Anaerolineae bacterium]
MKYRILLLALLAMCGLGVVQARDGEQEYRLHVPSASEYLKALPEIIKSYPTDDSGETSYDFIDALENIFEMRYGSTASAAELSQAYDLLDYGSIQGRNYMPYLDAKSWHKSIVERWFEENSVQLNNLPIIQFLTYTIDSTSYDFNGDGKPEWLLHVQRKGSFEDYWVAWSDQSQKSGYRFDDLPIPLQAEASLDRVEDLNGDGKPELIFESSATVSAASWVIAEGYYLYLVGWHKTGFEILTTNIYKNQEGEMRLQHTIPTIRTQGGKFWTFQNIDKDAALEILENARYEDNYECVENASAQYDWDGTYYRHINNERTEENSVNCALRDAEQAMWNYQYVQAVSLYETALDRYQTVSTADLWRFPHLKQFAAYTQERLVLAYALAGDMQSATALLDQMRREPSDPKLMISALLKVSEDGTTAFELCKSAYDFFDHYPQLYTPDFYQYRGLPDLGFSDTDYYGFNSTAKGVPPPPATVGCDIGQFANDIITAHSFSTSQPLVEQILQLGIDVDKQLHIDLNGDHIDDWVIWVKGGNRSFEFVSDGNLYRKLAPAYFPYPSENSNIFSRVLPDGSGSIWLILHPANTIADDCDQAGGSYIQALDIWALVNEKLVQQQSIPVCERPTVEDLFPDDQKLHAWKQLSGYYEYAPNAVFSSAIYRWDSKQRLYVLETPSTPIPSTEVPQTNPVVQSPSAIYSIDDLKSALWYKKDYANTLSIVDLLLKEGSYDDTDELHYYRALALEMLKRPDEALAEYVTIYKNTPESAWGKLAALHVECVANCGSS